MKLDWQHGARDIDIHRNGTIYSTRRNKLTFTDTFRIVGTGVMTYRACNFSTRQCSDEVSAEYTSKP